MQKLRVKINIKKLLNPIYVSFLNCSIFTQIFFGGSSSGKSTFLAQRVIYDLLVGERNYLCCRAVGRTLKTSIYNELVKVISHWEIENLFKINKSDMTITCINGYQAILKGLDDVEKIKSITPEQGVLTDIFIEEATEISLDDFKQLSKRLRGLSHKPKRICFALNPIFRGHWIYKEFFGNWDNNSNKLQTDDLLIVKTTHKDNQYLTEDDRQKLENEKDKFYYDVYTLGNWGVLGNLIFTNWRVEDLTEKSGIFDIIDNGLDFGYSNDPTFLIRAYYHRALRRVYVWQEYVNKKVTNQQIAEDIKFMVKKEVVVCDSAEPKSIDELCACGINAIGAKKGAGSVLYGIQWLQNQEIIIDKRCVNFINQIQQYHWAKDREGNSINKPAGRDEFCDVLRYALSHHMVEIDDEIIDVGRTAASQLEDW